MRDHARLPGLFAAVMLLTAVPLKAQTAEPLTDGQGSGITTPLVLEIDSEEGWTALWARHDNGRGRPRPSVDFSKDKVAARFRGDGSASFSMRAVPKPLPGLMTRPSHPRADLKKAHVLAGLDASDAARLFDGSPVKVLVRETNDMVFTPTGLLAYAVKPKVGDIYAPGYDTGHTHGMDLEVSKTDRKGVTYKLRAGSHLYTVPTAGQQSVYVKAVRPVIPEYFTEENTFEGTIDNFEGPDGLLWKAGAGVYALNSSHLSALGAAGQQKSFHAYTGKYNELQPQYQDVPNGLADRMAPYLDVALGYSRTLAEKGRRILRAVAYVEPRVFLSNGPLAAASSVKVHGELESSIKYKKAEAKLIVGADAIGHKDGTEVLPFVTLNYERKKWGVESKVYFPAGELQNAAGYNWDDSPYNSLAVYTFIGRGKRFDRRTAAAINSDF